MRELSHIPEIVDDKTVELSRRKSAAEITGIVSRMFTASRNRLKSYLRSQHPEWTESQMLAELRRRIHGTG